MKWQWFAPILLALASLSFMLAGAAGRDPAPNFLVAIALAIATGISAWRVLTLSSST